MLWIGSEDEDTECEDGDNDTDWQSQIESDMVHVLYALNIFFLQIFISWINTFSLGRHVFLGGIVLDYSCLAFK